MAEFSSLNGYMVKDTTARNIAKGRNQAVAFVDYATMIEALNELEKEEYKSGQNIYIGVVGVPDLWVYSVEDIRHTFDYVSDEDFVEKVTSNTTVQVGFFKLAMLEGQKVDLTTYDQKLAEHTDNLTEINNNLGGLRFGYDGDSDVYGYYKADDSFVPFRNIYDVINLGTGRTINITNIVGAKNIGKYNVDDFICELNYTNIFVDNNRDNHCDISANLETGLSKSYNPSTGVLTLSGGTIRVRSVVAGTSIEVVNYTANCNVISYLKLKTPRQ